LTLKGFAAGSPGLRTAASGILVESWFILNGFFCFQR
jgi:hypothetical protein